MLSKSSVVVLPLLLLLMAGAGVYWLGTWAKTTVVVLVRHAEAGEGSSGDPDLSPAGEKRVAALGGVLDELLVDRKVDYLYASDTRRAQQTAAPIANQFRLPINVLSSSDWSRLAARIRQHQVARPRRQRPLQLRDRLHLRSRFRTNPSTWCLTRPLAGVGKR